MKIQLHKNYHHINIGNKKQLLGAFLVILVVVFGLFSALTQLIYSELSIPTIAMTTVPDLALAVVAMCIIYKQKVSYMACQLEDAVRA